MRTYRKKFESLKMQGKDFMVVVTPLVGVLAAAMAARIPRKSQLTLFQLITSPYIYLEQHLPLVLLIPP